MPLGIPVPTGVDPRDPAFAARLAACGATAVLNQSEILLPAALLAAVPEGFVNRHASLLPAHRGRMAGFFAHAAPVPSHGFTIHRVTARLDDGPILHQQIVAGLDPRWGYPRIILNAAFGHACCVASSSRTSSTHCRRLLAAVANCGV